MRPKPIYPDRIRTIQGSFSWIDHRFITNGYIESLSKDEIILYYFLISVGDKNGVSYYRSDTIRELLKLDQASFSRARDELVLKDMVAYRDGIYQVLSLAEKYECARTHSPVVQISRIFNAMGISNT